MKNFKVKLTLMLLLAALISINLPTNAQQSLKIVWADWYPADCLQELSKDFTAETGISVEVIRIPWANFQDTVFTAFAMRNPLYDIVIGDSQWLGRNSVGGHYLNLTDWISVNIDVNSIHSSVMASFAEYPRDSGTYWALPTYVDAAGYVYRKDLFEVPAEMRAFRAKYGYPLAPPKTYVQLRDIAEFFTRPREDFYGIATWYSKDYDGITMGFQQVMWSFGGSYGDPKNYKVRGYLNSKETIRALEFYTDLLRFAPPNAANYYWPETLNAYCSGEVAMAMNYFAFFPVYLNPETNPAYHNKSGFFMAPAGPKGHYISVGGQGMSVSSYSKNKRFAKMYMKWFMQKPVQEKWALFSGSTPNREVLQSETFKTATPFNEVFAASFPYLRDFWRVPEYAELLQACQMNWSEVISKIKSTKDALDIVTRRHERIFKEAGYYDRRNGRPIKSTGPPAPSTPTQQFTPQPPQQIAKKALASTVLVVMEDANGQPISFGSGFFVERDMIATNLHVVEGVFNGYVKRVGANSTYRIAGIVAMDTQQDLAILKVSDIVRVPILPLGNSDGVQIGQPVYAMGNPKGYLEGTFTEGVVSGVREFQIGSRRIQISAPISKGSSGGPRVKQ